MRKGWAVMGRSRVKVVVEAVVGVKGLKIGWVGGS